MISQEIKAMRYLVNINPKKYKVSIYTTLLLGDTYYLVEQKTLWGYKHLCNIRRD